MPAGGTCGGPDCWSSIGTSGYKYGNPAPGAPGLAKIKLKGGTAGKSKILIKGRDAGLPLTASTLPFDDTEDVIVQLHNTDTAACWQSIFAPASVTRTTTGQYKAKTP